MKVCYEFEKYKNSQKKLLESKPEFQKKALNVCKFDVKFYATVLYHQSLLYFTDKTDFNLICLFRRDFRLSGPFRKKIIMLILSE